MNVFGSIPSLLIGIYNEAILDGLTRFECLHCLCYVKPQFGKTASSCTVASVHLLFLRGLEEVDTVMRPELNGRYGFVDAFLRDSERYRVFIPDVPGEAFPLALKSGNLERVTSAAGAFPLQSRTQPAAKPKAAPQ
eukprot:2460467-Amphidinium_carterae.2